MMINATTAHAYMKMIRKRIDRLSKRNIKVALAIEEIKETIKN